MIPYFPGDHRNLDGADSFFRLEFNGNRNSKKYRALAGGYEQKWCTAVGWAPALLTNIGALSNPTVRKGSRTCTPLLFTRLTGVYEVTGSLDSTELEVSESRNLKRSLQSSL
jgi:hypothetical protein